MQDKTRNVYHVIHVNQYITSYMSISKVLLNNLKLSHGNLHYLTIDSAKSKLYIYGRDCYISLINLDNDFFDLIHQVCQLIFLCQFQYHFHFVKTWYNDQKFVIPGVSHEKNCFNKILIILLFVTSRQFVMRMCTLKFLWFGNVAIFQSRSICLSVSKLQNFSFTVR